MSMKLFGAVLVIIGCGSFGFSLAATYKKELKSIRSLIRILGHMESELRFRLTPLPQLCRQAAAESNDIVGDVISDLAKQLESQVCPDVSSCMHATISLHRDIPPSTVLCLKELGLSLGRFDLTGQLSGIDAVRKCCEDHLNLLEHNKEVRLRSYQTLSLCAGAALAILLI